MPGRCIGEKVALVRRHNGEVEGGVLLADCVDKDYIAIDAGGGGVLVVLFVNCVMGRGRSHGSCCGRRPQGQSAWPGMHGGAEMAKSGGQLETSPTESRIEGLRTESKT